MRRVGCGEVNRRKAATEGEEYRLQLVRQQQIRIARQRFLAWIPERGWRAIAQPKLFDLARRLELLDHLFSRLQESLKCHALGGGRIKEEDRQLFVRFYEDAKWISPRETPELSTFDGMCPAESGSKRPAESADKPPEGKADKRHKHHSPVIPSPSVTVMPTLNAQSLFRPPGGGGPAVETDNARRLAALEADNARRLAALVAEL